MLLAGEQVIALAHSRGQALQARDLLALAMLVQHTPSLRASETFTPMCLPAFDAGAFLHAYVHFLHQVGVHCSRAACGMHTWISGVQGLAGRGNTGLLCMLPVIERSFCKWTA